MITNFKFRTFLITFFIKVNIYAWLYINRFHFNGSMTYIVVMSSSLSIYTFFDIEVMYFWILFFKVLINLWATTDFPLLCVEYICMAFSCMISLIYNKIYCFYLPVFCLVYDEIHLRLFLKSISKCNKFFIFQRNNPCVFIENINNT